MGSSWWSLYPHRIRIHLIPKWTFHILKSLWLLDSLAKLIFPVLLRNGIWHPKTHISFLLSPVLLLLLLSLSLPHTEFIGFSLDNRHTIRREVCVCVCVNQILNNEGFPAIFEWIHNTFGTIVVANVLFVVTWSCYLDYRWNLWICIRYWHL